MTTLLPIAGASCNFSAQHPQLTPDFSSLSAPVRSFYRWLKRWFDETGDVSPSTRYLAKKQKVSERAIYDRLRVLREAGFIQVEVTPGVERRITPLVDLPPPTQKPSATSPKGCTASSPAPSKPSPLQGLIQGSTSGVLPYSVSTQETHNTKTTTDNIAPPNLPVVVSSLCEVVSEPEAKELAREAVAQKLTPEQIKRVIAAYRVQAHRIRNRGAWLREALRRGFSPPAPAATYASDLPTGAEPVRVARVSDAALARGGSPEAQSGAVGAFMASLTPEQVQRATDEALGRVSGSLRVMVSQSIERQGLSSSYLVIAARRLYTMVTP